MVAVMVGQPRLVPPTRRGERLAGYFRVKPLVVVPTNLLSVPLDLGWLAEAVMAGRANAAVATWS